MALAFGCILLALAILAVNSGVQDLIRYRKWSAPVPLTQMLSLYLIFAFPGWILALPFVFFFEDPSGRRMWQMLAIGTCIGPVFVILADLLLAHRFVWEGDATAVVPAFWISFLTTALYVLFLRRLTPKPPAAPAQER